MTKFLLQLFFENNIYKWDKIVLKKTSVIIPLFIESFDIEKERNSNVINLGSQVNNILKTFYFRKC